MFGRIRRARGLLPALAVLILHSPGMLVVGCINCSLRSPAANEAPCPPSSRSIREQIPENYLQRYLKWKREFLSTGAGQRQWEKYAANPDFTLTIIVSREMGRNAEAGEYRWNQDGRLIAATITLGSRLDEGVHATPYLYPVISAFVEVMRVVDISGKEIAAAKIAHELGHINRASEIDPQLFALQKRLIPLYNQIFYSNGRNIGDPRLIELAQQMGGTPVEIARARELRAEADALLWVRERYPDKGIYKVLHRQIRKAFEAHPRVRIDHFKWDEASEAGMPSSPTILPPHSIREVIRERGKLQGSDF